MKYAKYLNKQGKKFRDLWGNYAGWAQTIMFIDDLKQFQKEKSEYLSKTLSPSVLDPVKRETINIKKLTDIKKRANSDMTYSPAHKVNPKKKKK